MAALRQQPRGPLRIDRSNLITRGLAFCQSGGQDGPFANVNNVTVAPFGIGQARGFVATSSQYLLSTDDKVQSGPLTFFVLARPSNVGGNKGLISIGAGTNDRTVLYTATGRISMFSGTPSTNGQAQGQFLTAGTTYALGGRINATNSRDVWVNGVQGGSNSSNVSPVPANRIAIGAVWASGAAVANQYFDGAIQLALVWNRALSDDEMRSLADNPWQVFASPVEEEDDVAPAGPDGGSLVVDPSALLLAGGPVSIRVSRRLPVQTGQMQLVGAEVSIHGSRTIGVQAAELSAVRGQVGLRAARRMAVAPVAATLTGGSFEFVYAPAEIGNGYSVQVSPAALDLSGGNITMRVSRRITAEPAEHTLAVGDVRLLVARRSGIGCAALQVLAGQALLRTTRRLPVDAAQLVNAAGAVTLRYSSQVEYTRAPAGTGYLPQRVEVQARPAQVGGSRPASIQRNNR